MLSAETCTLICDFLIALARTEKKLEVIRQLLAEENEFEPYAAFRRIDRASKQILHPRDISVFLADNGINLAEDTIALSYISHYDIDNDGALVFSEFLRSALPFDNPNLRSICTQRPTYEISKTSFLNKDVECILARLIENEISSYLELEPLKQTIKNQIDFSLEKCFQTIDASNAGYIDFENLLAFFSINNFFPYEEEIISILRRYDKNEDGRLDFSDFAAGVLPKFFKHTDITRANIQPVEKKLAAQTTKFSTPSKTGIIGSPIKSTIALSPSRNKYPFEPLRKPNIISNNNNNNSIASPIIASQLAHTQYLQEQQSQQQFASPKMADQQLSNSIQKSRIQQGSGIQTQSRYQQYSPFAVSPLKTHKIYQKDQ